VEKERNKKRSLLNNLSPENPSKKGGRTVKRPLKMLKGKEPGRENISSSQNATKRGEGKNTKSSEDQKSGQPKSGQKNFFKVNRKSRIRKDGGVDSEKKGNHERKE